jgi:uncharacterized repeat protein (TIGR01451 family)
VADAVVGGDQSCTVDARSDDVVFNKDEALSTKIITVVEPRLELAVNGPDSRYTDTVADFEIVLKNPGTAPARRVRVQATLPVNGRLLKGKDTTDYDKTTRRLHWMVDQIDPGAKPIKFAFQIRMGGAGDYEVFSEGTGEGGIKAAGRKTTEVVGMPDVDLVVSEAKRVVDVGGKTQFNITLRNYGTKDATQLVVMAKLSDNLKFENAGGGGTDVEIQRNENTHQVMFLIPKLGSGKEMILGIVVQVANDESKQATCKVSVTHDESGKEPFEDMASIKVTSSGRGPKAKQ